jgi:hypothetical protein
MRLQHSCSAFVIAIAGKAQAMIGVANSTSDRIDTPTLLASFTVNQGYITSSLDATAAGTCDITAGQCQVVWLVDLADNSLITTWVSSQSLNSFFRNDRNHHQAAIGSAHHHSQSAIQETPSRRKVDAEISLFRSIRSETASQTT